MGSRSLPGYVCLTLSLDLSTVIELMKRSIVTGFLIFSVAALAIGIFLSNSNDERPLDTDDLPWRIEHTADGDTRVFGLTLDRSTLADAERHLKASAELSLFVTPAGKYILEAYFDDVNLAGLAAKIVIVIDVPHATLEQIFSRGTRVSALGDGTRKVSLAGEDMALARRSPIASLTYLPRIRLDATQIEHRFGKPQLRIREAKNDTIHWLYPELGLDASLQTSAPSMLQYVAPRHFSALLAPLIREGEVLN